MKSFLKKLFKHYLGRYEVKEIYRQVFTSLNRDDKSRNHYVVLLDGFFNDEIWADDDADAIEQFKEMYQVV